MKATLLTIGDELLIGQVVNTNAAWLGDKLSLRGVELACRSPGGDSADATDPGCFGSVVVAADMMVGPRPVGGPTSGKQDIV